MKQKTHKALRKRVKITKHKKILTRHAGQNHFNSRDSGKITRKKRRDQEVNGAHDKAMRVLLPYM